MKCTSTPINNKTYEFLIGGSSKALWKFVRVKRPKSYIMIRTATILMIGAFVLLAGATEVVAQGDANPRPIFGDEQATQRIDDYLNLLHQGYSELEIFQDLGNANLLSENYESAAFWFERLLENTTDAQQHARFQERYVYATNKVNGKLPGVTKDWSKTIMDDYKSPGPSQYFMNASTVTVQADKNLKATKRKSLRAMETAYAPKLAVTNNGKVAFFSKAVAQKPETGIFSKKEIVHEIYRAENVNGQWKNIKKVAVCPKYYSAKHPTVSPDGSRLFFASNMPGTYGKYDIYVSEILADGSLGQPKNLGSKVNTRKDDMYPSIVNGGTLVYASNGRKGQGGLDLFAVTVQGNKLGKAKNLGNRINSRYDDFALTFSPSKGMGFVLSNRGDKKTVAQYAFGPKESHLSQVEKDDQKLWNALNDENNTEYSSTVFEDQ